MTEPVDLIDEAGLVLREETPAGADLRAALS